jgi:hypothetical protein
MATLQTDGSDADDAVTHSICDDCADNLDFQMGVTLNRYLDSLKIPIIALDEEGRTIAVNHEALTLYPDKNLSFTTIWRGRIFECAHARLPEGCMKPVHCSGCSIRFISAEVYRTGIGQKDVPSLFTSCTSDLTGKIDLRVSADKIDNIVVLRIVRC